MAEAALGALGLVLLPTSQSSARLWGLAALQSRPLT